MQNSFKIFCIDRRESYKKFESEFCNWKYIIIQTWLNTTTRFYCK